MALTIDQLVNKLARIGVIEAAADGAFHDLPYGQGGGGGTSNVRMLRATATPNGPPGFYIATFTYGIPPLTEQPFLQAVVLNPVTDYTYELNTFGSVDLLSAAVGVRVEWAGAGADPGLGGNVDIGLRVEPFVAT